MEWVKPFLARVECRCAIPLSVITMAIIDLILVMAMNVMYTNVVDGGRYWLWVEGSVAPLHAYVLT